MGELDQWVTQQAGSGWVLLLVVLLTALDGVLPPVPSETLVAAVAGVATATGRPHLLALGAAAALGAFLGDNSAYLIGRCSPLNRVATSRRARLRDAVHRMSRQFETHSGSILITARFVPVGRVAVNLSAGVSRFPWRRYVRFSAAASMLWATYVVGVGVVAGAWAQDNPLKAAALAVALALGIGVVVDVVRRWWQRRQA